MQAMRCSRLVSFAALCVATSGLVAQKPTVCFVGGAATATAGADGKILTYLQTRYTAANVTYKWATGLTNADILGYDAVVLSATADSSRYRGKVDLTRASVVSIKAEILAALASAVRTTLTGSIMPAFSMSVYSPLFAS